MSGTLTARLLTPARPLAEGTVAAVVAPAVAGQLTVLPQHAPMVAELVPGVVELRTGGAVQAAQVSEAYFVTGGFLEIAGDTVLVLAEAAEPVEGIDVARARTDLAEAEAALRGSFAADPAHVDRVDRAERARQRLLAARPAP